MGRHMGNEGTDKIYIYQNYLNFCNTANQSTRTKYVLLHIVNYQKVSIAFAIIIRVAPHENREHNTLPNYVKWNPSVL
jgi:hypothetical protein